MTNSAQVQIFGGVFPVVFAGTASKLWHIIDVSRQWSIKVEGRPQSLAD
jgi:hypothetical protein